MERRSWLGGLASAAGLCIALNLWACGQGVAREAGAAAGSADSNTCTAPDHGRISCSVVCDDGYTACGKLCTKLDSDGANCGVCGKACSGGQTCSNGVCVGTCLPGRTSCHGACTDLTSDDRNCGACGNNCSLDHGSSTCSQGQCQISSCHPGWANCDHDTNNGCETNVDSDRNNCGGCGVRCGDNEICEGGHTVRCGANEHREGNQCCDTSPKEMGWRPKTNPDPRGRRGTL